MGNDNARIIWMAKFNPDKHKLPKAGDESSIKEHLKLKYQDKKWYKSTNNEENDKKKNDKKRINDSEDENDEITPPNIRKIPKEGKDNNKLSSKNISTINEIQNKPTQLKKLSIGSTVTNNQNNNDGWNPQFPKNPNNSQSENVTKSKNPFDNEDEFDFGAISSLTDDKNNPFGWGELKTNINNDQQKQTKNKEDVMENMFDFSVSQKTKEQQKI